MSRRTAPLYTSSASMQCMATPQRPEQARSIFEALEMARFDGVRRAVLNNVAVLQASNTENNPTVPGGPPPHIHITPVDYALDLCRLWQSMQEHCERTGVQVIAPGLLTIRQRLMAMSSIIEWLVSRPGAPMPSHHALHTVISCNFFGVASILLKRNPNLATSRDLRGKTPLHICCKMALKISDVDFARYIRMLSDAGADVNAPDSEGMSPMSELISTLAASQRSYGLVRTRIQHSSLLTLQSVLVCLISEGASLYEADPRKTSPLEAAVHGGLKYTVLVRSSDIVYSAMCKSKKYTGNTEGDREWENMGYFKILPVEVILRIISSLSPRTAARGIGSTCKGLHAIARTNLLWQHLSQSSCMAMMRDAVRRFVGRDAASV